MWQLTVDVARWPEYTPTISRIEPLEPLQVGARVRIKQPGQPALIWTVTAFEPPALFQWETRLPWGTRMVGTHRILPTAAGCVNHLELELSGPGSWILGVVCGPMLGLALWLENRGFRRAATQESSPSTDPSPSDRSSSGSLR